MILTTILLAALSTAVLIKVVIVLIVIGFLLWLVNTKLPMDGTIKMILNFVVCLGVVLYILNVFGII